MPEVSQLCLVYVGQDLGEKTFCETAIITLKECTGSVGPELRGNPVQQDRTEIKFCLCRSGAEGFGYILKTAMPTFLHKYL